MSRRTNTLAQPGFTIVELLIVVIVIAILAAITLVAFNNVTNRAKASAASSAAEQASKKVAVYMVTNADQVPADLATAGVTDQNGTSYQFRTDSTTQPQKYCITATANSISYFINNTDQTSPKAGACPGHGVNGVQAVTNLVTVNPSLADGTTNGWLADFNGGAGTTTVQTTGGAAGPNFYRMTWTTAAPSGFRGASLGLNSGPYRMSASPNQPYVVSIAVRTNRAQGMQVCALFYNSSNNGSSQPCSTSIKTVANTWTTLTVSATSDAAATGVAIRAYGSNDALATPWQVGDTLDVDAAMIVAGSGNYNYGDGNTSNWVWNGTANYSTSTGPAL